MICLAGLLALALVIAPVAVLTGAIISANITIKFAVALAGCIVVGAMVIVFLLAVTPRRIRASHEAIEVFGLLPYRRKLSGERIAGVFSSESNPTSDNVLVKVVLHDRPHPIWIGIPQSSFPAAEIAATLQAMYGYCTVVPSLMPDAATFEAARRHYDGQGQFEWNHRHSWWMSMLGLKAAATLIATAATWNAFQSGLIARAMTSDRQLIIALVLMTVTATAGLLTLIELAHGGPLVKLTADEKGLTRHHWWRRHVTLSENISQVIATGRTWSPLIALTGDSDGHRRWGTWLRPKSWSGPSGASVSEPPIGMIAPLLLLYEPLQQGALVAVVQGESDSVDVDAEDLISAIPRASTLPHG